MAKNQKNNDATKGYASVSPGNGGRSRMTPEGQKRFLEKAFQIWDTPPDITVQTRIFAQSALPHGVQKGWTWERRNGNMLYVVTSGADLRKPKTPEGSFQPLGIPYGRYPRLLMAYIAEAASLKKKRIVEFADSFREFLHKLDLYDDGRTRRGVLKQLHMLIRASFEIAEVNTTRDYIQGHGEFKLSSGKYFLWGEKTSEHQSEFFTPYIELSEEFYREIIEHPVPLDMNVLKNLQSSFALDIYTWASYRAFQLQDEKKPVFIKWEYLALQFGSGCGRIYDFRRKFREYIDQVKVFYPQLKIDVSQTEHLIFYPCPPHVLSKNQSKLLS